MLRMLIEIHGFGADHWRVVRAPVCTLKRVWIDIENLFALRSDRRHFERKNALERDFTCVPAGYDGPFRIKWIRCSLGEFSQKSYPLRVIDINAGGCELFQAKVILEPSLIQDARNRHVPIANHDSCTS
jgi:hypothetical protein